MERTTSADGTTIAFDVAGDGPLVVIVGGAFNDRGTWSDLVEALAAEGFTAVSYDRRGRGDSGDTPPYAVEREIEDLAAVIASAGHGGPVYAHGVSSGGALLLRALAADVGVTRASVLEVPYRIEGAPPPPDRYVETLSSYVSAGDRSGLVEYFQTRVIGLPAAMVESFKSDPMWRKFEVLAPTLVYDGHVLGGDEQGVPVDLLSTISVPVLAVTSSGTRSWMAGTSEVVAAALPAGRFAQLEGGFHDVPPPVLAPALAAFYREG
jgi:pimeloyl-ACP methyl ester carboxylesterase